MTKNYSIALWRKWPRIVRTDSIETVKLKFMSKPYKHYSITLWRKGPHIVCRIRTDSIKAVKLLARISFLWSIVKIIDWEAEEVIFYKSKEDYINNIKET